MGEVMRINPQTQIADVAAEARAEALGGASGGAAKRSFADEISMFVSEVAAQSEAAEVQSEQLAQGQGNVHETALALEKADIEMRLLMKGRNKIIEAYQEISRMPV
jgi:flagellar hook-basal body complex protein FliE